jgi:hypothetical protein
MVLTLSRLSELSTTSLMCSGRLLSPAAALDQDLDRLALVHRAIAVGHTVEVRDPVEDAAGLDPAFEDVRRQFLDVGAGGGRTAADRDVVEERRQRGRNRLLLGKADAADCATRTDDPESSDRRLFVTDALEHGVRAEAVGELADALDRLVAALADDVGHTKLLRECDPVSVTAEDDDPLGAEPAGGDHAAQADSAVADDGDGLARADLRSECRVVPWLLRLH